MVIRGCSTNLDTRGNVVKGRQLSHGVTTMNQVIINRHDVTCRDYIRAPRCLKGPNYFERVATTAQQQPNT